MQHGRKTLIDQARAEFARHSSIIACSERQYVDEILREHSQRLMDDSEIRAHSIRPDSNVMTALSF